MKSFIIIVASIVFSTLLINQTPIIIEARQLKETDGQVHLNAASTDAFVPTSPGNSPGVGHKKGNTNVDQGFQDDLKHTEGRRLEKTNGPNYFKTGSKDDFAPTNPGNSPGIGHKKANENVKESKDDFKPKEDKRLKKTDGQDYSKTGSTDDFSPTNPGNSPGIGHKKANEKVKESKDDFKPKEDRQLKKTDGQEYSKTGSTDDFAPTNPGNSPGMGHKKGNANVKESKGDFESTEDKRLKKTKGRNYSKTGSTDDFAPTNPGNSPGMGHKKGDDFKPTTPGHSPGIGHNIKDDEPKA